MCGGARRACLSAELVTLHVYNLGLSVGGIKCFLKILVDYSGIATVPEVLQKYTNLSAIQ